MQSDVEKWLKERGYAPEIKDGKISVSDKNGKRYALDTTGFTEADGGFLASGDSIRHAVSQSGAGAPAHFTPLRNTLAAAGVSVGYDKSADAPIVNGQLLNKNDSRLLKLGDDYYIDKSYADSLIPKTYENPYKDEIRSLISELTDMHFTYDPSKDKALAAAQNQAMLAAKQSANSRGLLGGSTAEIMRQRAAEALVPEYEQLAYARFAEDRAAKKEAVSLLSGLAENAFSEYKGTTSLDLERKKQAAEAQSAADTNAYRADTLAQKNRELEQNQAAKTFANQLDKVLAMGEVDEAAAEILGIPVGTLTANEKQFMLKLQAAAESEKAERALWKEKEEGALAKEERDWLREKERLKMQTDEKIRAAFAIK